MTLILGATLALVEAELNGLGGLVLEVVVLVGLLSNLRSGYAIIEKNGTLGYLAVIAVDHNADGHAHEVIGGVERGLAGAQILHGDDATWAEVHVDGFLGRTEVDLTIGLGLNDIPVCEVKPSALGEVGLESRLIVCQVSHDGRNLDGAAKDKGVISASGIFHGLEIEAVVEVDWVEA